MKIAQPHEMSGKTVSGYFYCDNFMLIRFQDGDIAILKAVSVDGALQVRGAHLAELSPRQMAAFGIVQEVIDAKKEIAAYWDRKATYAALKIEFETT